MTQAGRDQYIEHHYHFTGTYSPEDGAGPSDDDADEDDGGDYGYTYTVGPWYTPLTYVLFLLAPLPLLIGGTSLQMVFKADPGPSVWWEIVYAVCVMGVSLYLEYRILFQALARTPWSYGTERVAAVLHFLAAAALFIYALSRDPMNAGSVGRLALDFAEILGPL
ncbi:hypothetical protein ACIO3O_12785 [Streptomyces sp. NPDC087440]|uniref:hypothetical protein n=1 Tax=Streptomyces sp. NPDC087440 TaxID=3365790 RepID=UPI0038005C99